MFVRCEENNSKRYDGSHAEVSAGAIVAINGVSITTKPSNKALKMSDKLELVFSYKHGRSRTWRAVVSDRESGVHMAATNDQDQGREPRVVSSDADQKLRDQDSRPKQREKKRPSSSPEPKPKKKLGK